MLRNIFKKGPKYRLPQRINWSGDKNHITSFLESYIENWIAKEKKQGNILIKKEKLSSY